LPSCGRFILLLKKEPITAD